MFGLFKKRKPAAREVSYNYSSIAVDMHSHVLPGIDDGAQNVDESIALISRMMDMGISKVIATPHIMADYYRNTPETINAALAELKEELQKRDIKIEVEAAAEHYFDETFEKRIDDGKLMIMGGQYVLFEFSFISRPLSYLSAIQKMREQGLTPILAHPERYLYMNIEQLRELKQWGCELQVNTVSLAGYYGPQSKSIAESLIDNEMVGFISSDMHHLKHAAAMEKALQSPYVERLLFNYPLKNIMLK